MAAGLGSELWPSNTKQANTASIHQDDSSPKLSRPKHHVTNPKHESKIFCYLEPTQSPAGGLQTAFS